MKFVSLKKVGFTLAQLIMVVAIICLLAVFALPARAQVSPLTLTALTNFPATLAAGATSTVTNIIPVPRYGGLALSVPFNVASGTASVVVGGSFTVDGTNYGCAPFTLTAAATGTTQAMLSTNWSTAQLAGYSGVNFTTLTNSSANGVLTNKAPSVNRVYYNY